jgi:hypothetical protein
VYLTLADNESIGAGDGYDPDDEAELAIANPRMSYTSLLAGRFDPVICNKVNVLKNCNTLTHLAIKYLDAPKIDCASQYGPSKWHENWQDD